ncbi:MAG: YicC family protein [Clostridia bacterium]|nr:YicC family protein [Clostridia bacterium]
MVSSMTGFGRAKEQIGDFDITVEIKSVNHRYFEFSSRLPRGYQFMEEKLKSLCHSAIARGKVELSVLIENHAQDAVVLELNEQYADAYVSALHQLAERYSLTDDITVSSLIGNSDIFSVRRSEADEETVTEAVLQVAGEALGRFIAMRKTEGERLAADISSRAEAIAEHVAFIEQRSPQTVSEYRVRLEQRIRELLQDAAVDEQRLLTETAVFADKIAVAEETVRLQSHLKQLHSMLEVDKDIGRKLDFLVQEMNRETNTIGSKAQDLEIGRHIVEMKAEIEKIREQVQNIE